MILPLPGSQYICLNNSNEGKDVDNTAVLVFICVYLYDKCLPRLHTA